MALHWSLIELSAKERQAEYLRQAREIALAERVARESGEGRGLISRLSAWVRGVALARVSKSALSQQVFR